MSKNAIKTVLLLGGLTGLLLAGGELIGGRQGLIIGLAISVLTSGISYFFAEKIALATYSAQPVTETENPDAYRRVAPMVRNLAHRMNIPMPKLWLIPDDSPNAFATGRNPEHSSLAFTEGILRLIDHRRAALAYRA